MFDSLQRTANIFGLNIPWILILLILAWIIYVLAGRLLYKGRETVFKGADNIVFNALVIILLVWKLSPVIFQFSTVTANPAAVLYLPGGKGGIVLGAVAALLYCIITVFKAENPRQSLIKAIVLNFAVLAASAVITLSIGSFVLSRTGSRVQEGLPGIGAEAPDFRLEDIDGRIYSLSDYRGKIVVINFWASWCPPCRAELPELKEFYEETDDDVIEFLSINLYETEQQPDELPQFIEDEELPYPVLIDRSGSVTDDYRIRTIPVTAIISPDGKISRIKNGAVTKSWLRDAVGE